MAVTPLEDALSRVGDRWTLLVVDALMPGPLRFGELSERVDGIAPNVLSKRLKQLESDGIVLGTPYSERPVRVAYALTGLGRELTGALSLIASWGAGLAEHHHEHHHAACGSPLVARLWCPTCDQPVDESDATSDIPA